MWLAQFFRVLHQDSSFAYCILPKAGASGRQVQLLFSPTYDAGEACKVGFLLHRDSDHSHLSVITRLISSAPCERDTEIDLQLSTIQSAPASLSSDSGEVVLHAITRAPAALPARIPAGASSTTTQSFAATPSNDAPLR